MTSVMDNDNHSGAPLSELLVSALQHKWLLIVPLLVATGLGAVYLTFATPIYEITAAVVIRPVNYDLTRPETGIVTTQAQLLNSPFLIRQALGQMTPPFQSPPDVDPVAHIRDSLSVKPVLDSDVINVTFRCEDAPQGERFVHQLLLVYKQARYEQVLRIFETAENIQRRRIMLDAQRRAYRELADGVVQVIEPPTAAEQPVWPRPLTVLSLSAVLGLAGSTGVLVLLAHGDQRVSNPYQLLRQLRLPILGCVSPIKVPWFKRKKSVRRALAVGHSPGSPVAEDFRAIRARLMASSEGLGSIIQIASPTSGEGKTTMTANLAISFAQLGKRVIVVDADLRNGSQHKIHGVPDTRGITSVLVGGMKLEEAIESSPHSPVHVLTRGPAIASPGDVLARPDFAELLNVLRSRYDIVLVDSPPLLIVADGIVCAAYVDKVILVMRARMTMLSNCAHALECLESVGVTTAGGVVNAFRSRNHYGSHYRYYRAEQQQRLLIPTRNARHGMVLDHSANASTKSAEENAAEASETVISPSEEEEEAGLADRPPDPHPAPGVTISGHGNPAAQAPIPQNRVRRWHHRLLNYVSWLYLVLVVFILLAVRLSSDQWWISTALAYLPKALLTMPAVVLVPLAAFWNRWALAPNLLAIALVLGPMMDLRLPWRPLLHPPAATSGEVNVVSCNIADFAFDWAGTLHEVMSYDPDVVAMQEVKSEMPTDFARQFDKWFQLKDGPYWVASRWPVQLSDTCHVDARNRKTALSVEVSSPYGTFQLVNLHMSSIRPALRKLNLRNTYNGSAAEAIEVLTRQREAEVRETRSFVQEVGEARPLVVLGDFNMPSTSYLYKEHWGDFINAFDHSGFGYGYTAPCGRSMLWPPNLPWLRIDHILVSSDWKPLMCRVGSQQGSDHRLIAATLTLQ